MDPEASLVPGAVPPQSWRAGDLHPHQHQQQQQQLLLQNQHQQQLQNQHQQQLQQQQQHQQHQQQHQLRHPQHLPQQQPYQRMGKQLPQKLWLQRQQLRLQQQQSQQKAHRPHQQNLQYQLLQQHERKHRQHHEHHEHREPHEAQSQSSPPAIQSSSSATAQSAAATAAGRSGGASFAISSAHGAVQKSVFRSLHGEADGGEAQTPASTAATPKTVMAAAVTDRDRPQPPLCSSRGRVPFGDCTWMIEAARKDGEGTAATAAAASGSIPSSPAGPSAISSNNGSLRTAVFKRPGAMLYAGSGNSSGTPLPASPSQPTSESVDKSSGGRPKPWRIEVPANIPHYIVPPPGRRFGGLAKTAGTGSSTAAAGRGYGQPVGTAGRSGTAAGRIQKSGTAGGGGISSGTAGPVVRYMDFNPWRGRCTEDRLNDTTVRNGNYDRVQSSQALTAETSTARGAWLPTALRRNNSTPMLAQLLALANALARERSQIAPGSQFKLPPRVTVTDTRRETWLRDLTNAAIPLRKLSRTIPHGLRGRVLLDQCAQKAVPVDRAMWLARCVGAQELRAFKRKGAASVATLAEAELRWLKDWTLTAQLFLDGALAELDLAGGDQEGDQGGRERLQYGARFVRQLYVERLLDHEQFLYWMLSGLRNAVRPPSAVDPTPYFGLWLFVIEAYFDDIMQRRRAACHLAMTLLGRLEQLEHHQLLHPGASSPTLALIQPKKMLQRIVRGHADTFVCQAVWPRCEQLLAKVLAASTNTDSPTSTSTPSDPDTYTYSLRHAVALSLIRRRNAALRPEMSVEMEQAIHMLLPLDDAIRHAVDFAAHFADFVRLDQAEAVPFVVRWCASIHRPGLAKVYVAARLIGELCGNDARLVTDHVLAFLSSDRRDKTEVPKTGQKQNTSANQRRLHVLHDRQHEGNKALYQLVGLLTERGLFVPGNYLALLILQSRPSDPAEIVSNGRPQVRLAAELPVALLDRPTSNLRANTLRRLGYDTAFEADDLNGILQEVEAVLEEQANHEQTDDTTMKDAPTSSLRPHMSFALLARCVEERSRNVKMAVAAWLDGHVVTPIQAAATTSPMALERVNAVQTLIEKTDDLGLLARFLLALTRSPQSLAVLAMCADTTSLHLAAFVALGQARQLYDQVMSRALAATVAVDVGTSTTFQTMLRPGTDLRPLLLALPALADKMLPPSAPGSLVLGVEGQPLRLVARNAAAAAGGSMTQQPTGNDISQRHYEAGPPRWQPACSVD
ncbi:RNA polymerase 2 mediator complex component [Grosmannia clavigera kw1407]|uniref:Mediator of RNA polymerase II transcription subunit 12 n=1 Tax=Grosmannia clavigera (strain kw1407 / UAMH 11150) TaxID=655863 RepID=F0XKH4_GROCL|nr:RNA polymerase 2 mediator complex component [Grosmannia clavigera kw1407]EFX01690.1 RNA polymerase 2 mediator complex component [Grosmannia clavigera kw1407]